MYSSRPLIIILIVSFFLQLLNFHEGQNWNAASDYAGYLMQAISIVEGKIDEFLIFNESIVSQSSFPIAPVAYPWGFPIFLSFLYKIFGLNLLAIKLSMFVFYAGFLTTLWFFFKDELDINERIILVSLFAFNPFFHQFGNHILSDIPFLFFSTLTILIIFKFEKEVNPPNKTLYILALAFCFFISSILRSHGLLFPLIYLSLIILFILKKYFLKLVLFKKLIFFKNFLIKKDILMLLTPLLIFVLFIYFFSIFFPSRQSIQVSIFQEINIKTFLLNCLYYLLIIKNFFYSTPTLRTIFDSFDPGIIIYILSLPFVFLGVKNKWDSKLVIILYVIITLALYISYPIRQGLRYIVPILPFYIYFLIIGLRVFKKQRNILIGKILVLFFLVNSTIQILKNIENNFQLSEGPYHADTIELFEYVKESVPENETVIFYKPRSLSLFTNRKTVHYNKIEDFDIREWYIVSKKSSFISNQKRNDLFKKFPAKLLYENNTFKVYKFID